MKNRSRRNKNKLGRNDPCACGSGKKFKKCHGSPCSIVNVGSTKKPVLSMENEIARLKAKQEQREDQQGKGNPIISSEYEGFRLVAVGSEIHYSKSWKTFHDFLMDYIVKMLGEDWISQEIKKESSERHPILQWYKLVCQYQKEFIKEPGKVQKAPMNGASAAYLGLAYNLYLIAHNLELQTKLIHRLKNKEQFLGAYYETYVAASFIQAGFEINLEDEGDSQMSHCEFVATHRGTSKSFSVEAKARTPGKRDAKVNRQLHNALKKVASHERIIFIDVNMPEDATDFKLTKWMNEALDDLRSAESRLTINGNPAPSAYVILTNHPYMYNLEDINFARAALVEGFKMPDFRYDSSYDNLRAALDSRDRHLEVLELMHSMKKYYQIPSTFDGEIPEFAFGDGANRLLVGNRYAVPGADGKDVVGVLKDVTVNDNTFVVYCAYELMDGSNTIVMDQLNEIEIAAYKKHPDTCFGIHKKQSRKVESPTDIVGMYDFFFKSYKNTPKDKLLEFMSNFHDYSNLINLSQEELARIYCEGCAYSAMHSSN